MQIEKHDLEKSQIELIIKIEPTEFEPFEKQAYEFLASQVKVRGFRKGKIPEKILKSHISDTQIFSEALEKALPIFFYKAIKQEKIISISRPEIKIDKYEKGKPIVVRAKVDVLPEFKIPDYKQIEIKQGIAKVSDKEVTFTLGELQKNFAEYRQKLEKSAKGDRAEIDFEGYLDNVQIDTLSSKNHPLVIGQNMFIPGFEDNLIGLNQGDVKEFEIKMPDKLRDPIAAGKNVKFKVKMNQLQRVILPKLDDEFAKKHSRFKTLNELKKDIKETLLKRKKIEIERKAETEIMQKLAEKIKIDLPDSMVNDELGRMINDISQDIERRGLKFVDYLKSLKKTEKQFLDELRPQAEKSVKIALIISKLGQEMKIKVSEKAVKDEIENIKKSGQQIQETEETKKYVKHILGNRKVMEKLKKECLKK